MGPLIFVDLNNTMFGIFFLNRIEWNRQIIKKWKVMKLNMI